MRSTLVGNGIGVTNDGAPVRGEHSAIFMCGHFPCKHTGSAPNRSHKGAAGQIRISKNANTPTKIISLLDFRFIVITSKNPEPCIFMHNPLH
jgi:hypothetical protein